MILVYTRMAVERAILASARMTKAVVILSLLAQRVIEGIEDQSFEILAFARMTFDIVILSLTENLQLFDCINLLR
ncbi:MAG: hypothetical protein HY428_01430 [Candidatus Levybacteria bacterium]|nr:hypothetical protein [Candidatus Levybacteria bacterium]